MSRARHLLTVPTVVALLVLVATGCSSSGTSSDPATGPSDGAWADADEVIASISGSGFDCSLDTSKNLKQVLTEHPVTKAPLGGSLVLCQGFQVLLLDDPAAYTASIKKDCATVTKDSLESPAMSRVVVVGDNYIISGTGPDQAYPEGAAPDVLAKAFAGKQQSLLEYYEALCTGIPAIEGSAAPSTTG